MSFRGWRQGRERHQKKFGTPPNARLLTLPWNVGTVRGDPVSIIDFRLVTLPIWASLSSSLNKDIGCEYLHYPF